MIPLENRVLLLKKLKEGWDIRNACQRAQVTRPDLFKQYKETPDFKIEVNKTIETFLARKAKKSMLSERHNLMKTKEVSRKRTK